MSDPETRAELLRLARQVERLDAHVEALHEAMETQTKLLREAIESRLPRSDFGIYRLITLGVGAAILIALIPGLATTLVPSLLRLIPR